MSLSASTVPEPTDYNVERPNGYMFMAFLVIVATCMATAIVTLFLQHGTYNVTNNLNRQIELWGEIETAFKLEVGTTADERVRERLYERHRTNVARKLDTIQALEKKLEQQWWLTKTFARLMGKSDSPISINDLEGVDRRIVANVRKYTQDPAVVNALGTSVWHTDLQLKFSSGNYLTPLINLVSLTRSATHRGVYISSQVIAVVFVLVMVYVTLFWYRYVINAFVRIEEQRDKLHQANVQIGQRNEQVSVAFQALQDAACLTDESGYILVYNSIFQELFLSAHHPGTSRKFQDAIRSSGLWHAEALPFGMKMTELTELLCNKEAFAMNDRKYIWRCKKVDVGGWLVMAHDKTDFIIERERQIHTERLEIMGRLSSSVAHDFNNILAAIMAKAEMISLEYDPPPEVNHQLELVVQTCERGRSLTSQLLSYSRKQTMTLMPYSIDAMIRKLSAEIVAPKWIDLTIEGSGSDKALIDLHYFTNAVENLVRNSVESIGENPGKIKICLYSKEPESRNDGVVLDVLDTGPGFAEEAICYGAEPFFSTKSQQNGTGLGLAMVAGFVEQCGGRFEFFNTADGALCRMIFPTKIGDYAVTPVGKDATYKPIDTLSRKHIRIANRQRCLLVEDDPNVREMMSRFLSLYFGEVMVAATLQEALEIAQTKIEIHAALCDWNLPDGNSKSIVEYIKSTFPAASVIIFTGMLESDMVAMAENLDVKVLDKPVPLGSLAEALGLGKLAMEPIASVHD